MISKPTTGTCSACDEVAPICCAVPSNNYTYKCWACCPCGRLSNAVKHIRARDLTGDEDIDEMLRACLETFRTKGVEYTVGSVDRLANFRGAAVDTGLTMSQVWYVFFNKHVRAVASYVKHGEVKSSESIQSRIMDCIVYLLLFSKMVKEKEKQDGRDPTAAP